jgi:hypothetical protein
MLWQRAALERQVRQGIHSYLEVHVEENHVEENHVDQGDIAEVEQFVQSQIRFSVLTGL